MIKVGSRDPVTRKLIGYKSIQYDENGWADAKLYLPKDYDLQIIKTDDGKTYRGWHTGKHWDGLNFGDKKVLYWKRYLQWDLEDD